MASIHLDQSGDCIDKEYDDYGAANAFSEPSILPRIGDEYQVQLPPQIEEPDYTSYSRNCIDATRPNKKFSSGLPITLTWIKHVGTQTSLDGRSDFKDVLETGTPVGPQMISVMHSDIKDVLETEVGSGEGYLLVPGLLNESWSDAERGSFLLGLYIFEKNFVEVKRFVESKEMGAIQCFYYGTFYGSEKYRRWSERRKTRNKKCVYGHRIFLGLRQQELLSRLLPKVPEECRSALVEISKAFSDEKMSLVDYISSLKAMVGMNSLVEAVGIGTGKQDLTGMALEPLRSNQMGPARPEIPTGKACSSLTTSEIIKFLSGDYRLSKARSNDLFWEAVWPRLLARGWHSEQPKDLVFLVPSVKKFSRRKLVKGYHYFDSISEILNKVAKEPGLIELDNNGVDGNKSKEDYEPTGRMKLEEDDENDVPTRQLHSYLQPRTPHRRARSTFTVIDTSLSGGKIRELRTLPPEISNALISPPDRVKDGDQDNLDDRTGNSSFGKTSSVSVKTSMKDLNDDKKSRKALRRGNADRIAPVSKRCKTLSATGHQEMEGGQAHFATGPTLSCHRLEGTRDGAIHFSTGLTLENGMSGSASNRHEEMRDGAFCFSTAATLKDAMSGCAATIHEEMRDGVICSSTDPTLANGLSGPSANIREEERGAGTIHSSTGPTFGDGLSSCCLGVQEFNENLISCHRDKLSSTSSSKDSPVESVDRIITNDTHSTEPILENSQSQPLIDLNLPRVPPDFENGVLDEDLREEQDNLSIKPDNLTLPKTSDVEAKPRRHSTRNHAPTTRALEALANGYLTVNRRRKYTAPTAHEGHVSRPSKRVRGAVDPTSMYTNDTTKGSHIEEADQNVASNIIKLQVLPENEKLVNSEGERPYIVPR